MAVGAVYGVRGVYFFIVQGAGSIRRTHLSIEPTLQCVGPGSMHTLMHRTGFNPHTADALKSPEFIGQQRKSIPKKKKKI